MAIGNLALKYIQLLEGVNDESVTESAHLARERRFEAWCEGVKDASGRWFNGDHHYLDKIDAGEMDDRPMCCGVFLDWKSTV